MSNPIYMDEHIRQVTADVAQRFNDVWTKQGHLNQDDILLLNAVVTYNSSLANLLLPDMLLLLSAGTWDWILFGDGPQAILTKELIDQRHEILVPLCFRSRYIENNQEAFKHLKKEWLYVDTHEQDIIRSIVYGVNVIWIIDMRWNTSIGRKIKEKVLHLTRSDTLDWLDALIQYKIKLPDSFQKQLITKERYAYSQLCAPYPGASNLYRALWEI